MHNNYFKVFRVRDVAAKAKADEHFFFFDSTSIESTDKAAQKAMHRAARFAAEDIPHSLCIYRGVAEYSHVDEIGTFAE